MTVADRVWPERTWHYIKDLDRAERAVKYLHRYCEQTYMSDAGKKEHTKLGFDVETKRTNPLRFPRAVWNGKTWDGKIRLFNIGTDPTVDEIRWGDKQFLFDVDYLGTEFLKVAFKDLFESVDLVLQNAKFDIMYLHMLGVYPKYITDTLLLDWIIGAGDHLQHGLADIYDRTFYTNPILFKRLTGLSLREYHQEKGKQQNFDWSTPKLDYGNLQYGADDVRLLFYAESHLWDRIEDYASRETQDGSIFNICRLEFSLVPIFAKMEQAGLKINVKKLVEEVIPLLQSKVKESRDQLLTIPQFRRFKPPGVHYELFFRASVGDALAKREKLVTIKGKQRAFKLSEQLKALIKNELGLLHNDVSVTAKPKAAGDEIRISIKRQFKDPKVFRKALFTICRSMLNKEEWDREPTHIINLNSYVQLAKAINGAFKAAGEKIKLPKNEKGNYCTDADTLQIIVDKYGEHRCAPIVYFQHYTEARGFNSKFGQGMLRHISDRGFVHCEWRQIGADTGRSSCANPPLHQAPSKKELFAYDEEYAIASAELIRSIYVCEKGNIFVCADFSQIEPVYTAQLTSDPVMRDIFNTGRDMHAETACAIYDRDYDELKAALKSEDKHEKEEATSQRGDGKQTNLATQYDMGYKKLAHKQFVRTKGKVDWTVDKYFEAKRIMKTWEQKYAGLTAFKKKVHKKLRRKAEKIGNLAYFDKHRDEFGAREPIAVLQNLFGRIRRWCNVSEYSDLKKRKNWPEAKLAKDYAPEGEDPDYYYNEFKRRMGSICRQGYNFLIQSGCADIHKYATLYVDQALNKELGSHPKWNPKTHCIRLTLHDELLVEVPEELADQALEIVKREMIRAAKMAIVDVPVKVEANKGYSWYEASPK